MTELETMQRAKMYLDKLAQGIDPITNQEVPEDSVLDQVRLVRCFQYVSGVLEKVIANGGVVGTLVRHKEFHITPEQLCRVQISQYPVSMTQLLEQIVTAVGGPEMKRPNAKAVSDWLVSNGLLEIQTTSDGKTRRLPTQNGLRVGLCAQMRQGSDGEYLAVYYDANAQRFLLEHLYEILRKES